jgi:hypothetical protein
MAAANSTEQKRQALLAAYSGQTWLDKVKKMSDEQVVAIYLRLKKQNKI